MLTRLGPPGGVVPVTVPGDVVLVQAPGLVVWVGEVSAFPEGFEFTLLTLFDTRRAEPPADWALDVPQRIHGTWMTIRFSDGRHRSADLNANTPRDQPEGPSLRMVDGWRSAAEGSARYRWWVEPLPPSGPVELAIHLDGDNNESGTGNLQGAAIRDAAARAQIMWLERVYEIKTADQD